jgi:hypothetical protein
MSFHPGGKLVLALCRKRFAFAFAPTVAFHLFVLSAEPSNNLVPGLALGCMFPTRERCALRACSNHDGAWVP